MDKTTNALKFSKPKKVHYGLDSVLDFGQYRGKMVSYVLNLDPEYLLWTVECVSWFDLDPDVLHDAERYAVVDDEPSWYEIYGDED